MPSSARWLRTLRVVGGRAPTLRRWSGSVLVLAACVGACHRAEPLGGQAGGETFAELRKIKGEVEVTPVGQAARVPYPHERLAEGEQLTLGAGGLAWIRRDGGAVWLVSGPAKLTLKSGAVELSEGRAFVDTGGGPPVQVTLPGGALELSDARASIQAGDKAGTSVYVLTGSARAGANRAAAGELLSLKPDGSATRTAQISFEDWTGGLATADPQAEPAPFGIGTVGARPPGDQGKPRFSLLIQRLDVRITIDHDFATTEVDETFVNPSPAIVEGLFSFRTPPGAVLSRFGVDRDGDLVWGRIQESRSAQAQYQSNVYAASTEDPALLSWVQPGVYGARFYPIAPGAPRRIVTRYSEWLSRQGSRADRRLYLYPMAADGARASLPHIEELTVKLDLSRAGAKRVLAGMGGKRDGDEVVIKAFDFVPRADLAVELFDDGQTDAVAYRAPHALEPDQGSDGQSYAKQVSGEEPDYLLVPLRGQPSAPTVSTGLDLAIVVDTSAATESGALGVARSLAQALLAQLGPSDRAALWAGDATLRPVAEGSGVLGALDPEKRRAWLAGLAAVEPGGATDLGAVITGAASQLDPKRLGAVIYIGDGQPSVGEVAPKALRDRLSRLPASTRVVTIGLGSNANMALLASIARGAPAEHVGDQYSAARAALRILEATSQPAWLGAAVDLGAGVERVLPRSLPPLTADEPIWVVGRLKGKTPNELSLRDNAGVAKRPLKVLPIADAGDLRRRWGQARLGELLEEGAGRSALVDVGRRFGLVSPVTSIYVPTRRETEAVVAKNEDEPDEDPESQRQAGRERRGFWKPWLTSWGIGTKYEASAASVSISDNREGGTGTRAKAEEGSMSKSAPAAASPPTLELAQRDSEQEKAVMAPHGAAPPPPQPIAAAAPLRPEELPAESVPTGSLDQGAAQAPMAGAKSAPSPMPRPAVSPYRGTSGLTNELDDTDKAKPAFAGGDGDLKVGAGGGAIRPGASGGGLAGIGSVGKVEGPNGNASVGSAVVSGGAVSNAARVVAGMRAGFRNCYQRGLAEDPSSLGTVTLTIRVGSGGEVAGVSPMPSGCLPASVISCVVARAQAAQFEPPDSGHAVISVPVTLVNPDNSGGCGNTRTATKPGAKPEPKPSRVAEPVGEEPPLATLATPLGVVGHTPRPCGPAADLPFDERRMLWRERLAARHSPPEAQQIYRDALANCEAPTWRERYALLIAMVGALDSVTDRVALWRRLLSSPTAADVVYRSIVARVQTADDLQQLHQALGIKTVDPDLLARMVLSGKSPTERLSLLRAAALKWPDDLELGLRVLDAYEDAGDDAGARALARRIRRRADATAHVRTSIGELFLRLAGREQGAPAERDTNEARRAFGELVEFAPEDPVARRRLGDLLRAHGWYEEAFRQYETLAQLTPDDQSVPLLQAAAAFGMGHVEEAVRWAEKAAQAGSPDGESPLAESARATASAFLAWARLRATSPDKKDELERLRGRARRLAQAATGAPGVRLIVTWAHPELRPALWTSALGAPMPAADNYPFFGVAECLLPESPTPALELRLEPEDAARVARLGAKVTVTALVGEGTATEQLTRLDVGFGGGSEPPKTRVRVVFEAGALRTEAL